MYRHATSRLIFSTLLLLIASTLVQAQTYPDKPIRLVAPFPPGGGTDLIARTLATKLSETKRWTVTVDNRAGANGIIGLAEISRANPAGYDLVIGQTDNLILSPWLQKVPYDSIKDFSPVAYIGGTPIVFLAAANGKFRTFAEVIAAAKAKPDSISIGSAGAGSSTQITSELMRTRNDIHLQHIPYKGSTPALTGLMGGQVDIVGSSIASATSMIRAGRVLPLAVSSATRSPSLPDVPTLAELGLRNISVEIWYGLFGPAGLSPELRRVLNAEINRVVLRPEVAKVLHDQGLEPKPVSPEEFARIVQTDYTSWKNTIAEIGLKLD